jgi:hypothetical protein
MSAISRKAGNVARSDIDQPYTPELIEIIMDNWPQIESCRASGTMSILASQKPRGSFDKVQARYNLGNMIPRATRRTNTAYQIDDLSAIVCDILKAMEQLTPLSLSRLMRYHNEGYTLEEIGQKDGCTKQAILYSLKASYQRMADWLESPKAPVEEPAYEYEIRTHTRSFSAPEFYIPPQR